MGIAFQGHPVSKSLTKTCTESNQPGEATTPADKAASWRNDPALVGQWRKVLLLINIPLGCDDCRRAWVLIILALPESSVNTVKTCYQYFMSLRYAKSWDEYQASCDKPLSTSC